MKYEFSRWWKALKSDPFLVVLVLGMLLIIPNWLFGSDKAAFSAAGTVLILLVFAHYQMMHQNKKK